jgi:hypothetical protein
MMNPTETMKQHISRWASTRVEVLVGGADQLHALLSDAEAALLPIAVRAGTAGVLVTRHSPHRYTVALCESVPFGETRERSAD